MTALTTLHPGPNAPAAIWANCISTRWRASVEAIIEVGHLLTAAKEALPHGAFGKMIENDLPFGASTARKLMAIAADPKLSNREHVNDLPPSWGTLYELSKLPEDEFAKRIESGAIHPEMERREVINGASAVMASRQQPANDLDYAPTPPWATRALMEHVLPRFASARSQRAWEPACGEGHMAEVLTEYFRFVHATDIHDYGYGDVIDFLGSDGRTAMPIDWIITNPPFEDKAEAFALHAIELATVGVAIFAQLRWLEGVGRYERLFRDRPPTQLAIFSERVPLTMRRWEPDASTATAYMWLVWAKACQPQPPCWIPPGCRTALTKPDDAQRFTAHPVRRIPHDKEKKLSPVPDYLDIPDFLRRTA